MGITTLNYYLNLFNENFIIHNYLNNTIIDFRPHITTRLQNDRFKAKVGVDVAIDIHDATKAYIFPIAEVKYSLFNDIFIPYVGARGGIKQTTFKSLTTENEFLLPNVAMRNENTAYLLQRQCRRVEQCVKTCS